MAIELYKFLWRTVKYEPYKSGDNQDWHSMDRAKIFSAHNALLSIT